MKVLFSAGRGIIVLALAGVTAVSCLQQTPRTMQLTRTQVAQRNLAVLESEYQQHIENNRKVYEQLQIALGKAVRAELVHADCAANGCWCTDKSVKSVRISSEEWFQVLSVLHRTQPLLAPHRETVVPSRPEIWSVNDEGKVVYRDFINPPLQLGDPQDKLMLYDASGRLLFALELWCVTRQSICETPAGAGNALVLSDADFATLASMPSFRAFFRFAAADWGSADWMLFEKKAGQE